MRITNTGLLYDDPTRSTLGYMLICPVDGDKTFLLRPDGSVAHRWKTKNGMTNWGAVRLMETRIRLLAQPEAMRSIVGATQ